jgi:hypothetical protein
MGFTVKQWHKYERDRMLALQNPPKPKIVKEKTVITKPKEVIRKKPTEQGLSNGEAIKIMDDIMGKELSKKKKPSKVSIDNKVRKLKDKWRKR